MIGFFPLPYEDELMNSSFSRYFCWSGYSCTADAYIDLFTNKNVRPSVELINNLTHDAIEVISNYKSQVELVKQHTMFPQYARFISSEKREKLLQDCDFEKGNWANWLRVAQVGEQRYLRYCPICAAEDRDKFGETYWHRRHQIMNIKVCLRHGIFLEDSTIVMDRNLTRLKVAEQIIPQRTTVRECKSKRILDLAEYLETVFLSEKYSHDKIGKYLDDKLDSHYRNPNGYLKLLDLYDGYCNFYADLNSPDLMTQDYMGKLLGGKYSNFYFVCQMAMFEEIPPDSLLEHGEDYADADIYKLVSIRLGQPRELVENIGTEILKEINRNKPQGTKQVRYQTYLKEEDERLLPEVKRMCREIYGIGNERPRRVTTKKISVCLGVDYHKFKKYKKCIEVVERYYETQEQYWAREMVWGVAQIEKDGYPLTYNRLRRLLNLTRGNIEDSMDRLKELDEQIYQKVRDVMG